MPRAIRPAVLGEAPALRQPQSQRAAPTASRERRASSPPRSTSGGAPGVHALILGAGPDEFKRLRPGRAVVIEPSARRPAELVRVWPARG